MWQFLGFPGGTSGKEPTCQCRRHRRLEFDLWVGKIPGGGNGNPLQYSCLENPMDREAWQATVHRVTKSRIWLKWLSTHTHGNSWFKFFRNYQIVFHGSWTILHPHQQCASVPVLPCPCQKLFSVFIVIFIMIATLVDVKWYRIMILIGVSLMTHDIEHLMCLLAVCRSMDKCLFKFFARVLIGLFGFIQLSCMCSFCKHFLSINFVWGMGELHGRRNTKMDKVRSLPSNCLQQRCEQWVPPAQTWHSESSVEKRRLHFWWSNLGAPWRVWAWGPTLKVGKQ